MTVHLQLQEGLLPIDSPPVGLVSWYAPAAETPVERLIPASARTTKDPGIDGRSVYEALASEYRLVARRDDFAVLAL